MPKLSANNKMLLKVVAVRLIVPVAITAVAIVVANKIESKMKTEN